MWERIKHIFLKETVQIRRDRRMLMIIFVAPVIQLMLLGYAVTTDVNRIPAAILDFSKTQESRELIQLFQNSDKFQINHYVDSPKELVKLLDRGEVWLGIEIGVNFAQELKTGKTAILQIIIDGTNSNTAGVTSGYINQLLLPYNKKLIQNVVQKKVAQALSSGIVPEIKFLNVENQQRAWYNPELKSRDYNLPGVLALILMITTMMLTSMAIVREKEIGTIEQLMVTPIKTPELILGKVIPFALIGFIDVVLVTSVAILWFKIPFRGNFFLLFLSVGVYLLTTIGIGLFISTLSRTQQQAMMITFFFLMPAIILSGFMFPIANMPKVIQYLTYINPLRYFLVIVRGIFLKGSNLSVLWDKLLPLAGIGIAVLIFSVLRFQKKLG
ncbi:MAG: ABC transporter permease [candidate division Zixibacteria bacterium]|nr:ABC transporter permease [candidate division Zixibacteria bacterium]